MAVPLFFQCRCSFACAPVGRWEKTAEQNAITITTTTCSGMNLFCWRGRALAAFVVGVGLSLSGRPDQRAHKIGVLLS